MKLRMPKYVLAQARAFGRQVEAELDHFIEAKMNGRPTRRLDKPCGYGADGSVQCQIHIDLRLRHYRLTAHADPLLIYQEYDDLLWIVGITRHEDIFSGRGRLWCYKWGALIFWEGCEDQFDQLRAEFKDHPID
jgi:hypothetical protein